MRQARLAPWGLRHPAATGRPSARLAPEEAPARWIFTGEELAALAEALPELVALALRQSRPRRGLFGLGGRAPKAIGGGRGEKRVRNIFGGFEHDLAEASAGPGRRLHGAPPSSPRSQTRTVFQSRTTVRGVTPRTAAVSATDRPAK